MFHHNSKARFFYLFPLIVVAWDYHIIIKIPGMFIEWGEFLKDISW